MSILTLGVSQDGCDDFAQVLLALHLPCFLASTTQMQEAEQNGNCQDEFRRDNKTPHQWTRRKDAKKVLEGETGNG